MRHCSHCGQPLVAAYCAACGQPSSSARRPLRDTLLGQTGRFFHTLRTLVTRPGELAVEIDQCRDRDSLKPLTMLFHLMAAFFLVSGYTGFGVQAVLELGYPLFQGWADAAVAAMGVPFPLGVERLQHRFQTVYTIFLPVVALAMGGLIALTHRRAGKPWIVPVAAGIHYECFTLLWLGALLCTLRALGLRAYASGPVLALQFTVGCAYIMLMLRRIYREAWGRALATALFALVATGVLANGLIFAAFYIATHLPA